MKTRNISFLAFFLLVAVGISMAYPKPAVVQNMNQWTLNTTYTQPEQIVLQLSPDQKPQRFWYVILTLTNETSLENVEFFPVCQLVTDTFETIPADKKVPGAVFEMIKLKHQGSYPFLESLDFKDHRIFRGKDNTRDIAIIWPDFDAKAKEISLFISGLSNETAVVEHPRLKDENGDPKKIFLQKTLQLKYAVGGDEKLRSNIRINQTKQDWVMR
jgi:hypothetical protein